MMKRLICLFLSIFMLAAVLCGCAAKEKDSGDGTYKIGWSYYDSADESLVYMTECVEAYAKEKGVELVSFDAQGDAQKQSDQIGTCISQGCDAILLVPIDATSVIPAMQKAKDAGLVVVNTNIELDPSADAIMDSYVGPNDIESGEFAGQLMMDALPDGGKVVEVGAPAGSSCQINRNKGFLSVTEGSNIEMIDSKNCTSWAAEECMAITEDFLTKYGDQINGIFCHWDNGAIGVAEAVEAAGMTGKIKIVAIDGCKNGFNMVKEGTIYGTVMQDLPLIMKTAVDMAIKVLNGEEVPKKTNPTWVPIDSSNVNDYTPGW